MTRMHNTVTGLALTGALVAGGLVSALPAEAAAPDLTEGETVSDLRPAVTQQTLDRAIAEAHDADAVTDDQMDALGRRAVTIDAGDGLSVVLASGGPSERLALGSDGRGAYIAFNSFDQNVIIGGAGAALVTGICALGPAACAIANAAVIMGASWLATHSKCPSPKSVRVYPITKKPARCV
jgi:hypothetical protein